MKSSGSSSATEKAPTPPAPGTAGPVGTRPTARTDAPAARRRFALTGPSIRLDLRAHAVRRDLADVRLADRVFAPHYAAALPRRLTRAASLRSGRDDAADTVAELETGEAFEVLEFAGGRAWGVAPGRDLVGYLDADALGAAA